MVGISAWLCLTKQQTMAWSTWVICAEAYQEGTVRYSTLLKPEITSRVRCVTVLTIRPGHFCLIRFYHHYNLEMTYSSTALTEDTGLPRELLFIFKYSSNGVLIFVVSDEARSQKNSNWVWLTLQWPNHFLFLSFRFAPKLSTKQQQSGLLKEENLKMVSWTVTGAVYTKTRCWLVQEKIWQTMVGCEAAAWEEGDRVCCKGKYYPANLHSRNMPLKSNFFPSREIALNQN